MEKRNFNILVVAICIGITAFWLTMYNIVAYDIDYLEYVNQSIKNINQDESLEEDVVLTFTGNVNDEFELTLEEIKSDKYRKVINEDFDYINSAGTVETYKYTGVTLWSIINTEDFIEIDAETFLPIGRDGYKAPTRLSIEDIAKKFEDQVIIAYEMDEEPLYERGPLRMVIDRDVLKHLEEQGYYCSQYWVYNLEEIEIE